MEQRSLRLGDLVDDYCPRERRVTNHVIVVVSGDAINQTRCNTCDAQHEYKEAKVPRKKLKNGEASDLAGGVLVPKAAPANGGAADVPPVPAAATPAPDAPPDNALQEPESNGGSETMPDGWLAHRPLIRATLPKSEGEAPPQPPRAIPEFTMHQRPGRGFGGRGGFRHGFSGSNGGRMPPSRGDGGGGGGHEPDGNRAPGGPGGPGGGGGGGKSRHRRRRRR
jgi:hypothetical protein